MTEAMLKTFYRNTRVGVGILALVLATAGVAFAQNDAAEPLDPDLLAQLDDLVAQTETLRDLEALRDVPMLFPGREEVRAYITESLAAEAPPEEIERATTFYVALGLLEPDVDLLDVYTELLGQQVAGYYDTDTQEMNTVALGEPITDSLSPIEQIIFVHEYTHALQDQYFDLDAITDELDDASPDQSLATTSLFEGDATLVMNNFTLALVEENPAVAFQILTDSAVMGSLEMPPGTPPILADELLFPYEAGLNFVTALQSEGGWDAVNEAFANPPTRTEHILHPDTYLEGQPLTDLPDLVDPGETFIQGWETAWETTLGEYYLRQHLDLYLTGSEAADAAEGWGNDQIAIYRNRDGQTMFQLVNTWDTEADSDEFVEAYRQWIDERYGESAGFEPDETGSATSAYCAEDDTDAACVYQFEDGVTLVAHAPTFDQAFGFGPG